MSETNVQLFPGVFRTTQGGSNPDFFLHSAGRVGIGNDAPDTPPAWNTNTTFKLNVTGHTHVNGNLDVTGYLYGDGSTLSGVAAVVGGYWDLDQANNNIKYDVGNVGIGGAAGTEKLTVHGDLNLDGGNLKLNGQTAVFSNWTSHTNGIYRSTNVGIGGVPSSTNKLKVHGTVEATSFSGIQASDVPTLSADKITTGTLDTDRIPTIGTNKISGLGFLATVSSYPTVTQTDFQWKKGGTGNVSHANYGSLGDWYIRSNNNSGKVIIQDSGGNVAIGTSSPIAKLHVQGTSPVDIASGDNAFLYWQMTSPGAYTFYTSSTAYDVPISIYASSKIATNADFVSSQGTYTASDSRIKRDIKELNDDDALVKLRQIQPKTYGYKDIGVRGEEEVIGFIADEVEEVLPTAVKKTTLTIPNILEVVNVAESNIISFTNFSTSNLSNTFTLECVDLRSSQDQYITIVKVIDDKTIQVKEDLSNWLGSFDEDGRLIVDTATSTLTPEEYEALENEEQEGYVKKDDVYEKTTASYPGDNLYIRGERVNDFRTLKKEMLFAINFSATQELDRQLQAEKDKVASLEERLAALEAIVLNQ